MTDSDSLGAQYREARDAIGPHRARQARAEVAYAETLQRHGFDRTALAVAEAQAAAEKARADVEWCKAVQLAAGEDYKGEPLDVILARNDAHRSDLAESRGRAFGLLASEDIQIDPPRCAVDEG